MNFGIHRKIPGINLTIISPEIVDLEQKMPQIGNLKILRIQLTYKKVIRNRQKN